MQLENNYPSTKDTVQQFLKMKLPQAAMPKPIIIKTVEDIMPQLMGMPKQPNTFEIKETYDRLLEAAQSNKLSWISDSDWRLAPYVFWYGEVILVEDVDFLHAYFSWLSKNMLPRNWRNLIKFYLLYYQHHVENKESFRIIAKMVQTALVNPTLKERLKNWSVRHQSYGLFNEDFIIKQSVSAFVVDAGCDWKHFSELMGLDGELSQGGYADAIGMELLQQLRTTSKLELINAIECFHFENNTLRFENRRTHIIEALLAPWVKQPYLKAENEKDAVYKLLLAHFHDPRLAFHKTKYWRLVSDDALKVMYRWLTEATIDQFFEIIDRMALEHQWKYRKKFWQAYFDKGVIDQAWVALGSNAQRVAHTAFGKHFSAGNIEGSGTDKDQSVLIIQIRDLIFAEWSHNGKCRAWKLDDPNCPVINQPQYFSREIKSHSMQIVPSHQADGITHNSSENYLWQNRLSEFIYNETGIRVSQHDYRI